MRLFTGSNTHSMSISALRKTIQLRGAGPPIWQSERSGQEIQHRQKASFIQRHLLAAVILF